MPFYHPAICQSTPAQHSKNTSPDTAIADRLNASSKIYWTKNLDSSQYYARKAMETAKRLDYKKGIAESYRNTGVTNMFIGDRKIARQSFHDALALFSSIPDEKGMAATYNNLGVLLTHMAEYPLSLSYLDSALRLFRKAGNQEGEGSVLNYIGINYQEQGKYQQAIDYCLQGFEIRKKINDNPGVVFSLLNVGNMYLEVGQLQSALNFYTQALAHAKQHAMDPPDYLLNQIGKTYLKLKQFEKAESYLVGTTNGKGRQVNDHLSTGELYAETGRLDSAILEFETYFKYAPASDNNGKALSLAGISKVLLKKKEYGLAMQYAQRAQQFSDSSQNLLTVAETATVLAGLYQLRGNYRQSLHFFELAHSITDSVTSENYQQKLAFTESKNEIENKQASIKLLSSEKALQEQKLRDEQFLKKLILILALVALSLSFIIIRNINSKRKKIQAQKDHIEIQSAKIELSYEELKAAQAQLIQKEKMASLGELTAGIAHEIQNPLNFVNNFSDVSNELIDEMKTELAAGNTQLANEIADDIKQNLEKINHHGKRADAIVKEMLQHSRSSSGQKEPTDINALADEYLRLSYHGIRAKDAQHSANKDFNITIKTDFDESIGKINIISQDIGRVLLNLYNNAFYAVNEKKKLRADSYEPRVTVSTKKMDNKVQITVEDNGNGIPQNIVDKIFQPFFTTKPTGQGTGLGLSLSYDIVKAHGGEIKVNSEEEGTEFIILLPTH